MIIRNKKIDNNSKCFIIAEIAQNHDRKIEQAKALIKLAAECGADAVKFQTFTGKDISIETQLSSEYNWPAAQKFKYWYEFLDSVALPFEWYPELIGYTHAKDLSFIATPCSPERASFLKEIGADVLKVASMDNDNFLLLERIRELNMPVILSTGMSTIGEAEIALNTLGYPENCNIALLHCISNYPSDPKTVNLPWINILKQSFQLEIGYSDHSETNFSAFASICFGAKIIEKHFTIDKKLPGPDHYFSLEPDQLKELVEGIREVEESIEYRNFINSKNRPDHKSSEKMKRGIHTVKSIKKGEVVTKDKIVVKRPRTGLPPIFYNNIIGLRTDHDIEAFQPVTWDLFRD